MNHQDKTKAQLINELNDLRRRLDLSESGRNSNLQKEISLTRTMLDASHELFALLERDGSIIECNSAMEERFKIPREKLIGMVVWSLFPQEVAESRKTMMEQVFLTGKPVHLEDLRQGIWNDTNIYPVFAHDGRVYRVTIHALDITERKAAQQSIIDSEKLLRSIAEHIPGAVFEFMRDSQGSYVMNFISAGSSDLFGLPLDKLTGPIDTRFIHPDDIELFFRSINESAETLSPWNHKYRIILPDNKIKWIQGKSLPKEGSNGSIVWNGVLIDITKEKELGEKLRQKEKLLRQAQEAAGLGYYLLNTRNGSAVWSDQTFKIFGLDPANGTPSVEEYGRLIHPDDRDQLYRLYGECIEKKIPFDLIYRIFHRSGEIRYVHSLGAMETDSRTGDEQMFGTLQDITPLKLAEQDLQMAHLRLEALWHIASLENSDRKTISDYTLKALGAMTRSPYGFLGFLNEEETTMTIHSWSGQAMADCRMDRKPEEYTLAECGVWAEAVRQRKPLLLNDYNVSHPAKRGLPAGHVGLTRLLVVPVFSQGKIVSVAAVANSGNPYNADDISQISSFMNNIHSMIEKKDIKERLEQSEESLQKAQKAAHLGSWEWEIATNRLTWSDEMYSLFGISREDFTGKLQDVITRSIHPDDLADVEASNLSVIEKRKPIPLEYRIILPDGSIRIVWAEAGELKLDEKGNPAVLSGIVQDITKRKEAEAEQKRLEAQLLQSQKLESLGQLAGGIAHDFNNQLSGIMGYAELINPGLDDSTLMRYVGNISQGAKNAATLTQQLLSFARKGQYSRELIDIHKILDEVVGILSHTIDKRIQIIQNRKMKNPTTLGDPSQIQNTLLNIALNARDAIEGSGRITFTTEFLRLEKPDKKLPVTLTPGDYIWIKVTDDGCGIDEETMKHIFDPFYTTKGVGKGTGMGLSAAYGAVIHHGGDLFAESEPLKGSTFHIMLPYRQAGTDSEKPGASSETLIPSEKPFKILIVDDDEAFRELLTVVLEDLGYLVHTAANGKEGLDYFTQYSKDLSLVILDMIMPKMGGEELYRSLRMINPKVKILVSSGYTPEDKSISRIVGEGTPFIQKPCSISELAQAVADALGRDPSSGTG